MKGSAGEGLPTPALAQAAKAEGAAAVETMQPVVRASEKRRCEAWRVHRQKKALIALRTVVLFATTRHRDSLGDSSADAVVTTLAKARCDVQRSMKG